MRFTLQQRRLIGLVLLTCWGCCAVAIKDPNSKVDDDEDGPLEAFIDIVNLVLAVINLYAIVFENGPEEAFARFCVLVILTAAAMAILMVVMACFGIDATPRSRTERNCFRAVELAANVSLADRNLRAYNYR